MAPSFKIPGFSGAFCNDNPALPDFNSYPAVAQIHSLELAFRLVLFSGFVSLPVIPISVMRWPIYLTQWQHWKFEGLQTATSAILESPDPWGQTTLTMYTRTEPPTSAAAMTTRRPLA